jgi:hypothetical protein
MYKFYGTVDLELIVIIENACAINYQDSGRSLLSEQRVVYSGLLFLI